MDDKIKSVLSEAIATEEAERRKYALLTSASIILLHYPAHAVQIARDLLAEIEKDEGK